MLVVCMVPNVRDRDRQSNHVVLLFPGRMGTHTLGSQGGASSVLMRKMILSLSAAVTLAQAPSVARAADAPVKVGLSAIAIPVSGRTDLAIGMIEARATLSPCLAITAAPTMLTIEGGETEYQFRAAFTVSAPIGPLQLDDRNMWTFSDAGSTRYRNRVRVTAPVDLGGRTLRLQLLDEISYEQGGRGWFRNMYGVGLGLDVNRSISIDAYVTRQDDRQRAPSSLFFIVLAARVIG